MSGMTGRGGPLPLVCPCCGQRFPITGCVVQHVRDYPECTVADVRRRLMDECDFSRSAIDRAVRELLRLGVLRDLRHGGIRHLLVVEVRIDDLVRRVRDAHGKGELAGLLPAQGASS